MTATKRNEDLVERAAKTPMSDHVARFWKLLAEHKVRITVECVDEYASSLFPDDVAKAVVASSAPDAGGAEGFNAGIEAAASLSPLAHKLLVSKHLACVPCVDGRLTGFVTPMEDTEHLIDFLTALAEIQAAAVRSLSRPTPARAEKETGWRPIAEAPMNEIVLVCNPDEGRVPIVAKLMAVGWINIGVIPVGRTSQDHKLEPEPTHYMPLPAPPKEST